MILLEYSTIFSLCFEVFSLEEKLKMTGKLEVSQLFGLIWASVIVWY